MTKLPTMPESEKILASARAKLWKARNNRVRPQHDDKILADWNGLFITALAEASLVFDRKEWTNAATSAFSECLNLFWKDNRLLHSHRVGSTRHEGTADDYASLVTAALALHALTGDPHTSPRRRSSQRHSKTITGTVRRGFYHASQKHTKLPIKSRTIEDDATPNANSVMIKNYNDLYHLTGDESFHTKAMQITEAFASAAKSNPFVAPGLLKNAILLQDAIQLVLTNDSNPAKNEDVIARA